MGAFPRHFHRKKNVFKKLFQARTVATGVCYRTLFQCFGRLLVLLYTDCTKSGEFGLFILFIFYSRMFQRSSFSAANQYGKTLINYTEKYKEMDNCFD